MATRKEAKRKTLLQLLTLLIVAAIIVAAVVAARTWQSSRPDPEPLETTVTATVGDTSVDVYPYMIAEPGVEPEEGAVTTVDLPEDQTLRIEVPRHVYDHDWQAVLIYDDPAANDQRLFGPHESNSIEVKATADPVGGEPRPKLLVVEIQSVLIGHDESGEPSPYTTVWSVATQHAE